MMRRRFSTWLASIVLLLAAPVAAQLGLPVGPLPLPTLPGTKDVFDRTLVTAGSLLEGTASQVAEHLKVARIERIDRLLRENREILERDADGEPARKGAILLIDPADGVLDGVLAMGFVARNKWQIEGLDLRVVELSLPPGLGLADAERLLRRRLPDAEIASDQIHFQSGTTSSPKFRPRGFSHPAIAPVDLPIGIIDSAPVQSVAALRGFANGAPRASDHGSAVVSLATWAGGRRLIVADVYGSDPAGGSALAISQALGWFAVSGVRVVSISLVGPRNPLVERAVRNAQAKGIVIIAAVGNDGAAAPPSFPASYHGVIAVTGVDRRNRPLIEAGRALHLDYAAPGAGVVALNARGDRVAVRGTSFAAPLIAVRAALALSRGQTIPAGLDAEAVPLAKRLPDPKTGRGLVCGVCR